MRPFPAGGWIALAAVVLAARPARAETVDFQDGVAPSAAYRGTRDTIIKNGAGINTLNFGLLPRVRVTTQDIGTNAQTWTLLRWDVAGHVPPGAVITGVQVTLWIDPTNAGPANPLHELRRPWVEGNGTTGSGASWLTYDGVNAWGTAGAENTTTDRGATSLGSVPGGAGQQVVTLNATGVAVVQGWVDDPANNFGLILRGASADSVDYLSRNDATATTRPRLTITFTVPPLPGPAPVTVTFQQGVSPSAAYAGSIDTFINQSATAENNGPDTTLECDQGGTNRRSALLRWDISSIPAGSTITAVTVGINVSGTGDDLQVFDLRRDWTEGNGSNNNGATWSRWDTPAASTWGTAGAESTTTDRGGTSFGTLGAGSTGNRTVALSGAGVTLVQGWLSTPANNDGLMLRATNTNNVIFASSENGTAANRPRLIVTYTPPASGGVAKSIAGGSSWATAGAWTPAGVPGVNDTVTITGAGTVTVTGTQTVARVVTTGSAGLTIGSGASLTVTGTFWVSNAVVNVTGTGVLRATGTTSVLHTSRLDLSGTPTVRLGASRCWLGGELRAAGGSIIADVVGTPSNVELRGAVNVDGLTFRGGDADGLHVCEQAEITRLRRVRFETIAAAAGSRFLTIDARYAFDLCSPGCFFEAPGAGKYNVQLTDLDTTNAGDVVLNVEQRTTALTGAGAGQPSERELGGAAINWVWACPDTTAGTPVGFPQTAYTLDTFAEYSTYVAWRDVDGAGTDRVDVFDPYGDGVKRAYWFDIAAAHGDLVGYPWWDQLASGQRILWVVTTTGRVLRFTDAGTATGAVAPDFVRTITDGGAVTFTTPPITMDTSMVFVGGTSAGSPRLYALAPADGALQWALATGLPQPITTELATELWQGKTRVFAGAGVILPGGTTLLNETFNASAGAFTYQDDGFRGTNNPGFASGAWVSGGGQSGGGVRVTLGALSVNMSGNYRATITVPQPTLVRVTFNYRLLLVPNFEFDEYGEALVSIDDVLLRTGQVDYLARFVGDGNGGPNMDTGWRAATFNLDLSAGAHTLRLGGFQNKGTEGPEVVQVFFDNVNVVTAPSDGRIYRVDTVLRLVDLEDPTPVSPVVAAPFPVYGLGLFVGDSTGTVHGLDQRTMTPIPGWPVSGGGAAIQGSVWFDYAADRVLWGDDDGALHGYTRAGAGLAGFPLADPFGAGLPIRSGPNVDQGILWATNVDGRLIAVDVAPTATVLPPSYRFGAGSPVSRVSQSWNGLPSVQVRGHYLVVPAVVDATVPQ